MVVLSPSAFFNIHFKDEIVQYPGVLKNDFDIFKAMLFFAMMEPF